MSGNSTAIGALGAAAAAGAGGPLAQVFSELALVMAIMGLAGGGVRGLSLRLPWREWLRGCAVGSGLAFGFGVLAPPILAGQLGIEVVPDGPTVPALAASAFVIGFLQDVVTAWLQSRNGGAK